VTAGRQHLHYDDAPSSLAILAYVTVTRAMTRLDNTGLAWVHTHPATSTPTREGARAEVLGVTGPPQAAQRPPGAAVPTEGTKVQTSGNGVSEGRHGVPKVALARDSEQACAGRRA